MDGRTRALAVALGALALFGILVAWFEGGPAPQRSSAAPWPETPEKSRPPSSPRAIVEAKVSAKIETHTPHDAHAKGPHPITEEHRKIQHENNLRALLDEALRARDAERVRALVREYRLRHPDDPNRLQEGYEVLAECLTNPGDAARLEATRYYEAHRSSILRRTIRRVCLEG
jgi:hypothetical protein